MFQLMFPFLDEIGFVILANIWHPYRP